MADIELNAVPAAPRQPSKLWKGVTGANWLIKLCFVVLAVLIAVALLAPLLATHDPNAQSLLSRLRPPLGFERYKEGYILGTDELGRDLYSRMLYGLRFTLLIAVIGSIISMLIGSTIGIISGYMGGVVDNILMALVDVQIAFPFTLMALLAVAVFGTDLTIFVIIIGLADWDKYARVVRGQVLAIRDAPYIDAVRVTGGRALPDHPAPYAGQHRLAHYRAVDLRGLERHPSGKLAVVSGPRRPTPHGDARLDDRLWPRLPRLLPAYRTSTRADDPRHRAGLPASGRLAQRYARRAFETSNLKKRPGPSSPPRSGRPEAAMK